MNKKNIEYIIISCIVLIILLTLGFILFKGNSDKKNKEEEKKSKFSEEDIINAYNMSSQDAINLVKTIYNGDSYEFEASINSNLKYIVTVKNIITESTTKYLVDPTKTNGSFYEINE